MENEEQLQEYLRSCLNTCEPRLVVYLDASLTVNYQQMVRNYAAEYPQYVMEIPKVTAKFYPEQGEKQVVELTFAYQTNPDELRMLQGKVARVFYSAFQHSSGEATDQKKAEKLYDFLMNRYEYVYQTTITPSYSLLLQGTGDSRTMAEIYSAMCRQVNVSCRTVTGKRNGITWTWNVVEIDGESYHLDLIYCKDKEEFIAEIVKYIASKWELLCREIERVFQNDLRRKIIELLVSNLRFWIANQNYRSVLMTLSPSGIEVLSLFDSSIMSAIKQWCTESSLDFESKKYTVRALLYGTLMLMGSEQTLPLLVERFRNKLEDEFSK